MDSNNWVEYKQNECKMREYGAERDGAPLECSTNSNIKIAADDASGRLDSDRVHHIHADSELPVHTKCIDGHNLSRAVFDANQEEHNGNALKKQTPTRIMREFSPTPMAI